jgi:Tfp pilus assembly pilus retraction ATPase PilT
MKKNLQYADIVNLLAATSPRITEMRLAGGAVPWLRQHGKWVESSFAVVTPESLAEVLNSKFGKFWTQGLDSQGSVILRDLQAQLKISVTKSVLGWRVHVLALGEMKTLNDFGLPSAYQDLLQRSNGLHVIAGPSLSGKSSFLAALALNLAELGKSVAFFSEEAPFRKLALVDFFEGKDLEAGLGMSRGYDTVILDLKDAKYWSWGLRLAEGGIPVLMSVPICGYQTALLSLSDALAGKNMESGANASELRFHQALQSLLSLRLLPGLEEVPQVGFELLLVNSEIRQKLQKNDWDGLRQAMFDLSEKSGMRTLNQCLLNLMLKRRIDFKVGFSHSPDPEELDRMLHQVGI